MRTGSGRREAGSTRHLLGPSGRTGGTVAMLSALTPIAPLAAQDPVPVLARAHHGTEQRRRLRRAAV